jgi:LAO/AO transport system kinase
MPPARAESQVTSAMRLLGGHPSNDHWSPRVLQLSALKAQGIDAFWQNVERFVQLRRGSGEYEARRPAAGAGVDVGHRGRAPEADFRSHPAVRQVLPTYAARCDRRARTSAVGRGPPVAESVRES